MASFIALSSSLSPNLATSLGQSDLKPFVATISDPELVTALTLRDLVIGKAKAAEVDEELALKIAFCESAFRQFGKNSKPLRGLHNPNDVGIFQINEDFHAKKSQTLGYDIYSTEGNIDYAMYLLKNQGGKPWNASRPCWGERTA